MMFKISKIIEIPLLMIKMEKIQKEEIEKTMILNILRVMIKITEREQNENIQVAREISAKNV